MVLGVINKTVLQLSWLIVLLILSACASQERLPPEFRFTTHITPQDYKLFQLSFPALPLDQQIRPQQNYNQRSRGDQQRNRERYVTRVLQRAVELSDFCREGYIQLGRYAGETTQRLRGQCRELASDQDRENFPNTLQRW